MANVHIHLAVSDLDASALFYERLLGSPPVKTRPGYRKFLPRMAPVNLALSQGTPAPAGRTGHLGIEVDSRDAVREHLARVRAAGLPVREEMDSDCCYANQDKFWARDPDGVEWEVYHVNRDVDDDGEGAVASACCAPSSPSLASIRTQA